MSLFMTLALMMGAAPSPSMFTPATDELGKYRSPLIFNDGQVVTTPAQWKQRRKEILDDWHRMMGLWPAVIEQPEVKTLSTTQQDGYVQHKIRFNLAPNHPTEGYLLIPPGKGPRPAVLVVFYEPETGIGEGKPNRDFARQLARHGFVTLSIGQQPSLYYPNRDKAQLQPLSALAYGAANAYHVLASRPEVDASRIGIVGHSYGGKWAMFASCLYEKFACAVWSDPGIVFDETRTSVNYWEPWYLGYEPTPSSQAIQKDHKWAAGRRRKNDGIPTPENPAFGLYPELIAQNRDLHELHALMAPRPFLVSGGAEDTAKRWPALNHSIAVNRLLGNKDRVAMTNRPTHDPNEKSNADIVWFFEHFLMPSATK